MKIYFDRSKSISSQFLLFVVATILALCSAAPEGGFKPLQCNIDASIDSEDCLSDAINLSSILSENESRALVIPCGTCVVVDYTDGSTINVPGGLNVIGRLHFPSSANVVLRTTAVFVQGMWSMTTPDDGNSVKISLHFDPVKEQKTLYPHGECCSNIWDFYGYNCNACTEPENLGWKPFAVVGGQLDIRVIDASCASWSKLKNVNVDTMKSIEVDKAMARCVRPGDEILITADSRDYDSHSKFIVDSVDKSTGEVFFEKKMNRVFPSEARIEEPKLAIEAALLRRDVVFHSEEYSGAHWIGGHLIVYVTPDVVQTIQGVRFENSGQEGELGRYPIHFHVCGDTKSLVSKNVIYDSNQRCIFIHNTNTVTVDDNVAYKTRGHCYATETGAEVNNIFSNNLASYTKDLRRNNGQSDSPGDFHNEAASFWFRNMENEYINNVAAGGAKRGFWIELADKQQNQLHPDSFINNTAHSYGTQGFMTYKSGWVPTEPNFVKNFVAFSNQEGAKFHINGDVTFTNALFADNIIGVRYGAWNVGTKFQDSVFMLSEPKKGRIGVIATFNNHPVRHKNMILENVVFRNFAKSATIEFYDNNLMEDDMGDPVHLYNVTMENCDEDSIPKIEECDPIYQNFFMEDFDGTMGPNNMGPGFFVRDNDRVKAFLPEDSCMAMTNGECGAFCEGICVRLVWLTPSGGLNDVTDYEMLQLTDTATGKSHEYSLNSEGQAMVVLPAGQYMGQFLDDNGVPLVDYNVDVEVFAEPRCSDFVTEEDFVFPNSLPPTDAPTTPNPTESPTIEPTRYFDKSYVSAGTDKKCPYDGRLFKLTKISNVDECHEKCFDMPSCNFFSYRSSKKMCIACSLDNASDLEGHDGFDAYELTSIKDSSDFNFELWNGLDGLHTKCPFGGDDRVGKGEDLSKRECYQMCKDTPNCKYFSYGEDEASSSHQGDCLLCQSDANFEYQKYFYTYELV